MWDRGLCGGPGIIGGSQIGVTASMTDVVVPIVLIATCNRAIDDSSAAIATDTSAVVDSTPMDLAISAVGVDPLVIADACIWSVSFFVGPSVGYVGERTAYAHHLYRPRGVQLNCHPISKLFASTTRVINPRASGIHFTCMCIPTTCHGHGEGAPSGLWPAAIGDLRPWRTKPPSRRKRQRTWILEDNVAQGST